MQVPGGAGHLLAAVLGQYTVCPGLNIIMKSLKRLGPQTKPPFKIKPVFSIVKHPHHLCPLHTGRPP